MPVLREYDRMGWGVETSWNKREKESLWVNDLFGDTRERFTILSKSRWYLYGDLHSLIKNLRWIERELLSLLNNFLLNRFLWSFNPSEGGSMILKTFLIFFFLLVLCLLDLRLLTRNWRSKETWMVESNEVRSCEVRSSCKSSWRRPFGSRSWEDLCVSRASSHPRKGGKKFHEI